MSLSPWLFGFVLWTAVPADARRAVPATTLLPRPTPTASNRSSSDQTVTTASLGDYPRVGHHHLAAHRHAAGSVDLGGNRHLVGRGVQGGRRAHDFVAAPRMPWSPRLPTASRRPLPAMAFVRTARSTPRGSMGPDGGG